MTKRLALLFLPATVLALFSSFYSFATLLLPLLVNESFVYFFGGELVVVCCWTLYFTLKCLDEASTMLDQATQCAIWFGFCIGAWKTQEHIQDQLLFWRFQSCALMTLCFTLATMILSPRSSSSTNKNAANTASREAHWSSKIVGAQMVVVPLAVLYSSLSAQGPPDVISSFVWQGFGYTYNLDMLNITDTSLAFIAILLTVCPVTMMGLVSGIGCLLYKDVKSLRVVALVPLLFCMANLLSLVLWKTYNTEQSSDQLQQIVIAHILLLLQANVIPISICGANEVWIKRQLSKESLKKD